MSHEMYVDSVHRRKAICPMLVGLFTSLLVCLLLLHRFHTNCSCQQISPLNLKPPISRELRHKRRPFSVYIQLMRQLNFKPQTTAAHNNNHGQGNQPFRSPTYQDRQLQIFRMGKTNSTNRNHPLQITRANQDPAAPPLRCLQMDFSRGDFGSAGISRTGGGRRHQSNEALRHRNGYRAVSV